MLATYSIHIKLRMMLAINQYNTGVTAGYAQVTYCMVVVNDV